jgi:hypothetical protein
MSKQSGSAQGATRCASSIASRHPRREETQNAHMYRRLFHPVRCFQQLFTIDQRFFQNQLPTMLSHETL